MRKRTIGIIYIVVALLELWGLSLVTQGLLNDGNAVFFVDHQTVSTLVVGGIILAVASIGSIFVWVSALINLAKAQQWSWFILMIFFGGIMLLIYLLVDLQSPGTSRYPQYAGQPQGPAYPPSPYAAPAAPMQTITPQMRRQFFRYGLLFGGISSGINLLWYALGYIPFLQPLFNNNLNPSLFDNTPFFMSMQGVGVPLLLTMPVFFWAGRVAGQRTGHASAGVDVALRAFGWLLIPMLIMFIIDITVYASTHSHIVILYHGAQPLTGTLLIIGFAVANLGSYSMFLLLLYGLSLPLTAIGAHTGRPYAPPAPMPQNLHYPSYPVNPGNIPYVPPASMPYVPPAPMPQNLPYPSGSSSSYPPAASNPQDY